MIVQTVRGDAGAFNYFFFFFDSFFADRGAGFFVTGLCGTEGA
jgi:hypothetical protein